MSAGHHAHRNNVPAIDDAFFARIKLLVDTCRIDRDHTIPWLANRSIDGRGVYIDVSVPTILPKTQINTGLTLPYHELGEWLGMNEGKEYNEAHQSCGNPCEKRRVEELGCDWQAYQEEMQAYVREVDDEAMTRVPADIDKRVFIDDDDKAALEAIIADNQGNPPVNSAEDDLAGDADEIILGVYVGSAKACRPAKNLGFECLNVFDVPWCKTDGCVHIPIMATDKSVDPVALAKAVDQIEAWDAAGKTLLVHCRKGIERAPLVVAVWLSEHRGLSLDEAFDLVAAGRPQIEDRRDWLTKKGPRMQLKYVSGSVLADNMLGERQIRVIASDPTVDRVKDIMVPEGCVLDSYKANPIVLFNHDPSAPIGNAAVAVQNGRVEALIDFAPKGISTKADEICALYKTGVLRAVSVGFQPIEYEQIKDGGVRYNKWALMELSGVSVPANSNAVTIERSMATSTKAASWKVGASRNLPIDKDSSWDGPAAEKSIFDHCGFDGDKPNTALARKGFLFYDASKPKLKGSYKEPFAKMSSGRLTAVAAGIRAAASRLPGTDVPDDLKKSARAVIDHYEAKMKDDGKGLLVPVTKLIEYGKNGKIKIKGLYECAELAHVLWQLDFIHDHAVFEQQVERDASKLPEMLAGILTDAAAALVAMTQEETAELLAGHGIDVMPPDEDYVEAAATPQVKALRAAFRKAGRVLSQENMEHLAEIGKCLKGMTACHEKAAELHDFLHDNLVDMMDHGTSLGEHLKAMRKAAKKKPAENGNDADEDGEEGEDVADPSNADQELAAEVEARKRVTEVMERAVTL